jgi:SpoVK/Ycf46/Vps4 family AAA+-type ATPase
MEEKTQPVFVVATANNIAQLPPELLRKGRLDEIFFVDLPTRRNRAAILMIHLARRQRTPTDYDIAAVANATGNFSGAELEEVVVNALYEAYASPERELKTEHLLKAAREIIPLAHSRAREIEVLRQWAAVNCRMAASAETAEAEGESEGVAGRPARMVDL